jgi:hypothetical protein
MRAPGRCADRRAARLHPQRRRENSGENIPPEDDDKKVMTPSMKHRSATPITAKATAFARVGSAGEAMASVSLAGQVESMTTRR